MVRKTNLFDFFNILLMLVLCVTMVYPVLYIFYVSISDGHAIYTGTVMFYPSGVNLGAYNLILKHGEIPRAFRNSVIYSVLGTVVYLIANCIVAYPLIYGKKFWLNKPLSIYYIVTMFVSGGMIPTYLLYRSLGFIDNILVMVLPGALGVFTIMVFKTNFQTLGMELIESGYLDGANDFQILFKLVIPLSKAILAAFALFQLVGIWNNFFTPLLYFTKRELYPLTLVLRRLLIQSTTEEYRRILDEQIYKQTWKGKEVQEESIKAASIIVTIVPILFIYPFLQKYFAKGFMVGSLKG